MSEDKSIASDATPTRYSGFNGQYIAGAWRHGRQGEVEVDNNPFSGDTFAEIVTAIGIAEEPGPPLAPGR